MTRVLPRTNFNSSPYVRLLSDLALVEASEPGHAFAERLGSWLNFKDAIALSSVLASLPSGTVANMVTQSTDSSAQISELLTRVRTDLTQSITRSFSPAVSHSRLRVPTLNPTDPIEIVTAYEPYRRFYLAHQREMEQKIRPLRSQVRNALAHASHPLRQLAALDTVLDKALAERESRLLATVATLLEKRYVQRLKNHQATKALTGEIDDPRTWMQFEGWLAGFCRELQTALLAEIDVRLQPVIGLIEALTQENRTH